MSDSKWFIKDDLVHGESQDAFAHLDFARQLKEKIKELPPPLSIALSGMHGTGKSYIGDLLQEQFRNDDRYKFVRLEAWRHEGESRRKAFLYDVIEELKKSCAENSKACSDLVSLQHELYLTQAHQVSQLDFQPAKEFLSTLRQGINERPARIAISTAFVTVLLLLGWIWFSQPNLTFAVAFFKSLAPLILSLPVIAGILSYFFLMLKEISKKLLEPTKVTVTANPASSSEQFEHIFRKALNAALGEGKSVKTLVLFVDELDRLPGEEILEAIRAIRTFRDVSPCVFVVALEEEKVKRALAVPHSDGLIRNGSEAEEYLNKIFKLRQRLPLLVSQDMREYAERLIRDSVHITAGIAELNQEEVSDVLDALIHTGVRTPRHVIRLINAFNDKYRLARTREEGNSPLISQGAITNHLPFLAVATALQEDFPDFYRDLAQDRGLIAALDSLLGGVEQEMFEKTYPGYTELCAQYFLVSENEEPLFKRIKIGEPREQWRDIVLYLRDTARFRSQSVVPFIFMRENRAARLLGSKLSEEMASEFQNYYVAGLRQRIEKGGDTYATEAANVALICIDESKGSQQENTLLSVCEIFHKLDSSMQARVADRVSHRIAQNDRVLKQADPAALLNVLEKAPDFNRKNCLQGLLARLDPEEWESGIDVLNALVRHSHLITEQRHFTIISDFTSRMANKAPLPRAIALESDIV